jgi:hypothetical protein
LHFYMSFTICVKSNDHWQPVINRAIFFRICKKQDKLNNPIPSKEYSLTKENILELFRLLFESGA